VKVITAAGYVLSGGKRAGSVDAYASTVPVAGSITTTCASGKRPRASDFHTASESSGWSV